MKLARSSPCPPKVRAASYEWFGFDSRGRRWRWAGRCSYAEPRPLLLQIEQALQDLVDGGAATTIDLTAMPFSARTRKICGNNWGRAKSLPSWRYFGATLIQETALSGVWLVEHKDAEGHRLTLHLEVTPVPSILITPEADIADGLTLLKGANRPPESAQDE